MHGAGNDFIVVDDRTVTFPFRDREWVAAICSRRQGIGSEGVILIQSSAEADFRMRFFNPDGGEAEMCGNGIRCAARFACDAGMAPSSARVETAAGEVRTEVHGEAVRVFMPHPRDLQMDQVLNLDDGLIRYGFVNTGVPHTVITVGDLQSCDVVGIGRAVRRHPVFAPQGTNVNFVQVTGPHALRIRTYERGVEAETGACGTGIVAAALLASQRGAVTPPVEVTVSGGDVLSVDFELREGLPDQVTLFGPAVYVYRGEIEAPEAL